MASGTSSAGCSGAAEPRTRSTAQPRRGADIETEATIGFADSIEGVTVSLRLSSDAPCPDCSGTGAKAGTLPRVCPDCEGVGMRAASVGGAFTMNETCPTCRGRGLIVDDPCPTCHGSGRGMSNRTISARIPAGVKDGQRIRLRGKGANGERGGPPGDLYVTVKVSSHQLFGRKGDSLTLTVPVSFTEATLGADIKVPTLNGGPVTLKIPAGTPNGRTFRVRGKGSGSARTDTPVTCSSPSRCRFLRTSTPRRARPSRHSVTRPAAPTSAPTCSPRADLPGAPHDQRRPGAPGPEVPVYVISVAAAADRPAPADPAHLRPARTGPSRAHRGWRRRYSWRDIELLREVAELTSSGIGLEGVRRILALEHHVDALQRRVAELEQDLASAEYALHQTLSRGTTKNLPAVRTTTPSGQSITVWRRGRS